MRHDLEPPSTEWIQGRILVLGALAGLNDQARGITLALIETGCRPSELCNIEPEDIFMDVQVPHIHIRAGSTAPRCSDRRIPLVGVAMEVFTRHPNGFPRYRNREPSFVSVTNRYLRRHGLWPSTHHSLYALRHAFRMRMLEHGVDPDLRTALMGDRFERLPKFFETAPLQPCRDALIAMALGFDPAIV